MNRLLDLVFPDRIRIENPLADRTRSEALQVLKEHDAAELLALTRSCARSITAHPKGHCGTCSQCVDRRFATAYAGLERHDPQEECAVDIFRDVLREPTSKTFAVSYVGFAQRTRSYDPDELILAHPELLEWLDPGAADFGASAERLVGMLGRHATEVTEVIKRQVELHSQQLAERSLPAESLVGMALGIGVSDDGTGGPDGEDRDIDAQSDSVAVEKADPDGATAGSLERHGQTGFQDDVTRLGPNRLERERKGWFVAFGNEKEYVDDTVGMKRLVRLLKAPGRELTALDLVAGSSPGSHPQQVDDTDGGRGHGDQEVIDDAAMRSYKERLHKLQALLQEAQEIGDQEKIDQVESEMNDLTDEITRSQGKGGKRRKMSDEHERARSAVAKSLIKARQAMAEQMPELGTHLERSLRVGAICSYAPYPSQPWQVRE